LLDQSAGLLDLEDKVDGIVTALTGRHVNVVKAQLLQVLIKVLLLDLGLWFSLLVQDACTFIDSS
jgi:hypothetical protein